MSRISNMPPAAAGDVQSTDSTYLFDANGVRKDKRLTIGVLTDVVSAGVVVTPASIAAAGATEGQALILTGGAWAPGTIPSGGDGGGSGDVAGPASAVNARIATFSGTSGKAIADSGYTAATLPVSTPTQAALDAQAAEFDADISAIEASVAANAATAATAQATATAASATATSAAAAAAAAQATADLKAPLAHDHPAADGTTLEERLTAMQLAIDAIQTGGTFGTFLDPMWSIATGSGPGEVVVSISSFPLSTRPVNSVGYLMDGISYSVPVATPFTIQTNTPGVSEAIALRVETSISIGGDWSEPKSATAGAAVAPSAFADADWVLTPGSGSAMATVEILSRPYNGGATISAIEIQYNSTGSWVDIGGVAPGTYNVPAVGISGAATGRLRATNSAGPCLTPSPTKNVTIPGGATKPATFGANQWSWGAGTLPGSYALNIIALPGDGGSAITALEYSLNAGTDWDALTGTGTGARQLTGFTAGASGTAIVRAVNAVDEGDPSASKTATATTGSALVGGTVTEANGFRVHTLTADGDLTVHGTTKLVNYELVGPGGGGGYGRGGGGGGGEIERGTATLALGANAHVRGAGGVAASVAGTNGGNGGNSTFAGITATGGGGGAGATGTAGNAGGSGGGGRGGDTGVASAGGTASGSNTNAGGAGFLSATTAQQHGGGGGGAGAAGGAATANAAGAGGNGSASTAPGVATIYSGGGGGSRNVTTLDGALGGNAGTTGGQGAGGTTSGNQATAGITPGSGGGGGLGGTRLPAAGAGGILHVWYPIGEIIIPADIIVTTSAQLTTALNNVTADTNSRYIIGLASGFNVAGTFTYPANYNKGSTCVQIRSEDRLNPATFRALSARNSRNVEFVGLEFIGVEEDVFGFPGRVNDIRGGATGLDIRDARGVAPWYVKVRDCYFDHHYIICDANNTKRVRMEYCSFLGYAVDGVRIYGETRTDMIEDFVFDHCWFSPISGRFTFPDVSAVVGWTVNPACASDARRSDGWRRDQGATILDLDGVSRVITTAIQDERHCDAYQSIRTTRDIKVLDCQFIFPDQYCHTAILQTNSNLAGNGHAYSTGFEMRRCLTLGVHSMSPGLMDYIDPIVHTCLFRRLAVTNYTSGNGASYPAPLTRNLDISGLNPSTRFLMTNCVLPLNTPRDGDYDAAWCTEVDVVMSNTAVPTGWAATDVALGKVGYYGHEN